MIRDNLIRTKLLYEPRDGHLLSLGFGNVASSQADVVCISAYNDEYFTPTSAIGAIAKQVGDDSLLQHWPVYRPV